MCKQNMRYYYYHSQRIIGKWNIIPIFECVCHRTLAGATFPMCCFPWFKMRIREQRQCAHSKPDDCLILDKAKPHPRQLGLFLRKQSDVFFNEFGKPKWRLVGISPELLVFRQSCSSSSVVVLILIFQRDFFSIFLFCTATCIWNRSIPVLSKSMFV